MRKRKRWTCFSSCNFLNLQCRQILILEFLTWGVGRRHATLDGSSLIVRTCVCPVCQTAPPRAHTHPQPGSGVRGTFSMASLLNIIICVIRHLPFIYFYLFFWLGNLGSSPDRLQKSLSTCSSSSPPAPSLPFLLPGCFITSVMTAWATAALPATSPWTPLPQTHKFI